MSDNCNDPTRSPDKVKEATGIDWPLLQHQKKMLLMMMEDRELRLHAALFETTAQGIINMIDSLQDCECEARVCPGGSSKAEAEKFVFGRLLTDDDEKTPDSICMLCRLHPVREPGKKFCQYCTDGGMMG